VAKTIQYNLTEGSILGAIRRLALPMVASMILNDVLQLVNLFFVSRLGSEFVAGMTMGQVFMQLFFMVAMGISTGTVAMVARYVGAGKKAEAQNVVYQSVTVGLFFAIIMTLLGLFLAEWAMGLLGTKGSVKEYGAIYLQIIAVGGVFIFAPFCLNSALRGAGDAVTPMKVMMLTNVLNIILAPLLIFGYIGFPRLEIAGAAWASVISRGAGMVYILRVFLGGKGYFHLRLREFRVDFPVMWALLKIGVFGSLQMLFRNISAIFIARIVAVFGVTAMASYGIVMRIINSVLMPSMAFGNASATLVGQNLGAGQPERAARTVWICVGIYATFMLVLSVMFNPLADDIVRFFNKDPEVIVEGTRFLKVFSATFFFLAFSSIIGRALTGAGDTVSPMIMTGLALILFRLPLCYVLSKQLGMIGIWIGMASSNVIQGLIFPFWFRKGRWQGVRID